MTVPLSIIQLIDHFHSSIDLYRAGSLNETQTRIEFIDPFFAALGWDIRNEQQASDIYKDVVHEDSLKISDTKKAKAPDYSFRIGGARKFFVEAKKPAVNVGTNISAAFQLRRYGWSAKLPLSILTDFEEFAIYDCRIMPNKNDSASTARVIYFKYTEYVDKWHEIYNLLSKEAVLNGSLDKFAGTKVKSGITVDKAFLQEIENWRENLAANIAWRNLQIQQRELNCAVQMTINRIVFLRICEDRGIEIYEQLFNLLRLENIYGELGRLFRNADYRYNSGLFHFQTEKGRDNPDDFTLNLKIDDTTLKPIIRKLYLPESPYEFSVIPVEILGQVYEQFLGKVITLSASRQAVIEDKPEVRKAGGVYYTPSYIVDYIVKQTIGKVLEGKKPEKIQEITILDPACGSGSFLIVAYQFLLDWYLQQYLKNFKKYKSKIYQITASNWRLTSTERKRILLTHIYGVDIDQQAVETSKLSLLLKVLQGESGETITKQLTLFKERALPDLDNNIQCGNSLIDGEFYQNNKLNLLDEDTAYRVNIFDWKSAFSNIMKQGGFDVVIGNPPYIRIQALKEWASLEVKFYKKQYVSASQGNYDIYVIFVEKGLNLLKKDGYLGFILPHKFFNAQYGESLRRLISEGKFLEKIVHFGDQQVFPKVSTYTCLCFLSKTKQSEVSFIQVKDLLKWIINENAEETLVIDKSLTSQTWDFGKSKNSVLFDKFNNDKFISLSQLKTNISQGIRTSANEIYVVDFIRQEDNLLQVYSKALNKIVTIESNLTSLFLQGREIKPYQLLYSSKLLIIPYEQTNGNVHLINEDKFRNNYPLTFAYLMQTKQFLENREKGKMLGLDWYAYIYPKNIELMKKPKILVPDIANRASFAWDEKGDYAFTSGYGIILKNNVQESIKYILGLLNSKVLDFYLKNISTTIRGGFFRYFTQFIEQLPIRLIDFSNSQEKNIYNQIIQLVEQMLALHKQLNQAQTPPAKKRIQQQIKATDRQINQLVYELYGLTDEEILIVEGA
ncbi:MAG: N-6 DNA methylase [Nostoc sp.]|uniref:Eco57I restriction-modification methylase domain-containing protein n=1 Tax=Nostoc sp. TaxID=1180 RepID=UPI002FF99D8C